MVIERRKNLSEQELNEIKKRRLRKIETDFTSIRKIINKKLAVMKKKLVGQIDILKSRKECSNHFFILCFCFHRTSNVKNTELSILEDLSNPKTSFLHLIHVIHHFLAISDDNHNVDRR